MLKVINYGAKMCSKGFAIGSAVWCAMTLYACYVWQSFIKSTSGVWYSLEDWCTMMNQRLVYRSAVHESLGYLLGCVIALGVTLSIYGITIILSEKKES